MKVLTGFVRGLQKIEFFLQKIKYPSGTAIIPTLLDSLNSSPRNFW
jgi:hypothetical protein